MKTRMVTRLKEDFIHIRRGHLVIPRLEDYELVGLVETRPVYPIAEAIPIGQQAALQAWRDKMGGVKRRK